MTKIIIIDRTQLETIIKESYYSDTEAVFKTNNLPKEFNELYIYFNNIYPDHDSLLTNNIKRVIIISANKEYQFDRKDVVFEKKPPYNKPSARVSFKLFIEKYGTSSDKNRYLSPPKSSTLEKVPDTLTKDYSPSKTLSKNELFQKLEKLKYWIVEKRYFGFIDIIDAKLKPIKKEIKQKDIEKSTEGADILFSEGKKISKSTYDSFIRKLSQKKLVYINDEWHFVNKLNTNYSDISKLISDIIFEDIGNNPNGIGGEILSRLSKSSSEITDKKILMYFKPQIVSLFDKYIKEPQQLFDYTERSKTASEEGEKIENSVLEKLKDLEYKEVYQGGNGDFIDMIFSVDLIVKDKDGKIVTIQVKSSGNQAQKFIQDFNEGMHQAVDMLIYPSSKGFNTYNTRTKTWDRI